MSKYLVVMKIGWQNAMAYRSNFIISSCLNVFRLVAEVAFWNIYFNMTQNTSIANYSLNSMITYYILMFVIGTMMDMGEVGGRVANDIKSGALNQYIIKPISYFGYQFSEILSRKLLEVFITIIAFIPIFMIYYDKITINMNINQIWLMPLVIVLAIVLNFFVNVSISLAAFWFTELTSFFFLKSILLSLLSGGMFPIDLFPAGILKIFNLLPFKYIVFFPINVLNKGVSFKEFITGICLQILWIVVLYLGAKFLWKKGVKHYDGTGM